MSLAAVSAHVTWGLLMRVHDLLQGHRVEGRARATRSNGLLASRCTPCASGPAWAATRLL